MQAAQAKAKEGAEEGMVVVPQVTRMRRRCCICAARPAALVRGRILPLLGSDNANLRYIMLGYKYWTMEDERSFLFLHRTSYILPYRTVTMLLYATSRDKHGAWKSRILSFPV